MSKKNDYAIAIQWNIYAETCTIKAVQGIEIEPIQLKELPAEKEKFQVLIRMPNHPDRILNLPQIIHSIYPVVLDDKPRTVIHGTLNRKTGLCEYVIAIKRDSKVTKKDVVTGVFGLGVFPLARRVKRLSGTPLSYASDVFDEAKRSLRPSKLFASKSNREEDQKFLSSWSDEFAETATKRYGYMAIACGFISFCYLIVGILCLMPSTLYVAIPTLFFTTIMLHRRYEAKNRTRVHFFKYIFKLVSLKGL